MDYDTARVRYFINLADRQATWLARCEVCNKQKASEIHHMRGRLGDLLADQRYFLGVCRACHQRITEHPELAYEMGWSTRRQWGGQCRAPQQ